MNDNSRVDEFEDLADCAEGEALEACVGEDKSGADLLREGVHHCEDEAADESDEAQHRSERGINRRDAPRNEGAGEKHSHGDRHLHDDVVVSHDATVNRVGRRSPVGLFEGPARVLGRLRVGLAVGRAIGDCARRLLRSLGCAGHPLSAPSVRIRARLVARHARISRGGAGLLCPLSFELVENRVRHAPS